MRLTGLLLSGLALTFHSSAQTVFWTEAFENSCATGCLASAYNGSNGQWSITSTGSEGSHPNNWFVSCAENGNAAGNCGSGCGTDESLHVGNVAGGPWAPAFCPGGDCGAAYDASAACTCSGILCSSCSACTGALCAFDLCCGGSCNRCTSGNCGCATQEITSLTDRRAESPTIDCSSRSSIELNFSYIETGSGTADDATVWYYNGSSWSQVHQTAKTNNSGCAGQGRWTAVTTINLPASANNNANVRIGFRWVNNADGAGADPSFAVDDVTLTDNTVLPIDDIHFTVEYVASVSQLEWRPQAHHARYHVQRSHDGARFVWLSEVKNDHNELLTFTDFHPESGVNYYRLAMESEDGAIQYSEVRSVSHTLDQIDNRGTIAHGDRVYVPYAHCGSAEAMLVVTSLSGQLIHQAPVVADHHRCAIDVTNWATGTYIAELVPASGHGSVQRHYIVKP